MFHLFIPLFSLYIHFHYNLSTYLSFFSFGGKGEGRGDRFHGIAKEGLTECYLGQPEM